MRFIALSITICVGALALQAQAFCGFYVAKADTDLFNEASKVVLVREGNRTVITMASDYQGEAEDFAMVVPVPTLLEREQIHVTDNAIVDHLDAYTAPRLVEYFDHDPCTPRFEMMMRSSAVSEDSVAKNAAAQAKALGVTIEAEYTVGEYDILILSAKQSDGLTTWLNENDYVMPDGAEAILGSYIKQGTKFFVAKVNLEEQAKRGSSFLRPLQIAFESEKFMLPIRLGTLNANGPQELFVFTLTRKGRVESTNYRTTKIPSNVDVPLFVKDEFSAFYQAMFGQAVEKDAMKTVMMEYAWDMNWCDPCAADPLSNDQLRELGVFWIPKSQERRAPVQPVKPGQVVGRPIIVPPQPQAKDVFVTRLHVRYSAETFPEDIQFQETSDRENFQGRYVLRHPWTGEASCSELDAYQQQLANRFEEEAKNLASLTGWDIHTIREKMQQSGQTVADFRPKEDKKWWQKLWD